MKRDTRDKFASGTKQDDLTTGNACWETAPLIYAQLNEDFGPFDVDLTADAQRHLCPVWVGPDSPVGEFDAIVAPWSTHGRNGYSNPPYGAFISGSQSKKAPRLGLLEKAGIEAGLGFASTLLLPLRITRAFRAHAMTGAAEVLLPDKRLVFFENGVPRINLTHWREKGKARADGALFDSVIVRYLPGHEGAPRLGEWKVPKHVTVQDLERAAEQMRARELAEKVA